MHRYLRLYFGLWTNINYIILLVFCSPLSISSPFSWFSCCSDTLSSLVLFTFLSFSFLFCVCVHVHTHACSVGQLCLTLCDPMDCSLPGSSVHGIFQAKILEWATALLLQVIFWTQGLSLHLLRLLHWQMDSLPLHFLTFLVLQGASGSYCVFPATVFKSAIYLTSTGFIWRTRVFETKIWLLGVNSLFWGLFKMGFIPEMQWFLNFRRSIKIIIAID